MQDQGTALLLRGWDLAHATGTFTCRSLRAVWAPAQNSMGKIAETCSSPEGSKRRDRKGSGGLILMGGARVGVTSVCVGKRGAGWARSGWDCGSGVCTVD